MANNKLRIQQFRTNDLVDDSGKQIEFGKDWNQNFFEISDSDESATINLTFKSLSADHESLDGTSIELKLASVTKRGDRKAYVNGEHGYSQLKYFFIHSLHLTKTAIGNDYFAIYKKSPIEYFLYFVPAVLYSNFLSLFQKDVPLVESSDHALDASSDNPYAKLLLMKKNLILTGAPGTGKTFLSKIIAAKVIGNCEWDSLTADQRKQVGFVQFHPSYDYTDFVEGLRPNEEGEFSRQDGVFKEFCKRAINTNFDIAYDQLIKDLKSAEEPLKLKTPTGSEFAISVNTKGGLKLHTGTDFHYQGSLTKKVLKNQLGEGNANKDWPGYYKGVEALLRSQYGLNGDNSIESKSYVFIIDEINRGELSKIFGELFYSIEPDYRGPKGTVQTQYNNMVDEDDVFKDGFYVPDNVYIIGTMNDVDRGVEAMDFAIRRCFGWKEVTAEESAENMGLAEDAKAKMKALNDALIEAGLTNAHKIGGAYFRKLKDNDYDSLWNYHLGGIVFEYFRGEPDAQQKLDAVKKAYFDAALISKSSQNTDNSEQNENSDKE